MRNESTYKSEAERKTRNLGLVMGLLVVPLLAGFMYIDRVSPELRGILGWRIVALVPSLLFLAYALFLFPKSPRLTVPLHVVQLAGLIVMMCGICADLETRAALPQFARTALISSLLVCIFVDFVFAGGARKYLFAILVPPLAVMSVYVAATGRFLTQTELAWLISNPGAMAVALSVLALYQERSNAKEFMTRAELGHAEAALRESEKKYHGLFDRLEFVIATTRTGLDIIDEDYIVQYVDPARRAVMGEPAGRSCHEYFRGRSTPCEECAMQAALKTRKVQVREQTFPSEDNRPTQVTAMPYPVEGGKWLVAEVIVDIGERKQAEAERLDLEHRVASSQKLEGLGVLAGGVAHNFNNLLTVILGHAEILRESLFHDPAASSSVREIITAGHRSRDLVSQLLSLGRRRALELKPLDLNTVVGECRAMLRQALRENIAIDYRLSPSPCPVAADPGRIEEILLNLALNAQDAIPREGRLEIETAEVTLAQAFARRRDDIPAGRYIRLAVSDTGEGMDEKTVTKIFDPFFTTKEPGKGTGLGLSTVYGIVKQHNGSIEVASVPGRGTRFLLHFPRTEAPVENAQAPEPARPTEGTETVLLVEDEACIRTMLARHLRGLGYTVLEAADGISALLASSEHRGEVHMLVTDVVMPGMSGWELHDRLCGQIPGLKALFMSGYPKDVIARHGADARMELMKKPFTGHALATRVREILDR